MFGKKKFWQVKYLGGWHEFPTSKSAYLYVEGKGLVAKSMFLQKSLFLIPWAAIEDMGQQLVHKHEQSALGGVMQGLGMIGAAGGGKPGLNSVGNQLAGFALQSAGQSSMKSVTEHYLEILYCVNGVKGTASFEFQAGFWNKRPVLEFMGRVNQVRINQKMRVS